MSQTCTFWNHVAPHSINIRVDRKLTASSKGRSRMSLQIWLTSMLSAAFAENNKVWLYKYFDMHLKAFTARKDLWVQHSWSKECWVSWQWRKNRWRRQINGNIVWIIWSLFVDVGVQHDSFSESQGFFYLRSSVTLSLSLFILSQVLYITQTLHHISNQVN